jgi:GNAT superfamily N-acetyltransferase
LTERETLAALLARAFDDDPTMTWVFPVATLRARDLRRLFAANLAHASRHGWVDRASAGDGAAADDRATGVGSGDAAGVALWLGPGAFPMRAWQALLSGHAALPLTLSLTSLRRMRRLTAYAQMQHLRTVAGPHWYLHGIGVEPDRQREGIGTTLLRLGLERADRDHLPCYLETARESTLPFYARFGFRVAIPGRLPPDGPPVFSLLRPAAVKRPAEVKRPVISTAATRD